MEYSQEDLDKVLSKLNSGVIGKRKQGTWDTMVKKTKFTKQSVIEEAKKYKYYHDFKTERNGEFQYAERYGFLDELNLERKFNTDRDFESIKKIAQHYNNRWAFQLGSVKNYNKAKREGWLDEICSHMIDVYTEYTFEMCKEIAKQYLSRTKWAKSHQNSYAVALRKGWVKEIFPSIKTCGRVPITYTKNEIIDLAKKYFKRSDFRRNEQKAMLFARKQGWLNEILDSQFSNKKK